MKKPIASLTEENPPNESDLIDLLQISDFVLLELQKPFDLTKSVAPACLPTKGPSIYYVLRVIESGWVGQKRHIWLTNYHVILGPKPTTSPLKRF